MGARSHVAAALAHMETAFAGMARTVDAKDLDRRRELIALRRELSDHFVALNRAVEMSLSAAQVEAGMFNEYHAHFLAFRRAVSIHQTEWPAILISDNIAGYVSASQALRRKREDFVSWMHGNFLPRIAA